MSTLEATAAVQLDGQEMTLIFNALRAQAIRTDGHESDQNVVLAAKIMLAKKQFHAAAYDVFDRRYGFSSNKGQAWQASQA